MTDASKARTVLAVTVAALLWAAILTGGRSAAAAVLEVGKTVPVRAETGNRAVAVTIRNAALVDRYGDAKAPAGRTFLVLSTAWENVLPSRVTAENKNIPNGYKIPDLAENVYVIVNGRRVARLSADAAKLPGHLTVKDFGLPGLGDTAAGNLIFDLPADLAASVETLELRFYDLTHGQFAAQLVGDAPAEPKVINVPRSNEVMRAGVYGLTKANAVGGKTAPAGMTYVTLDFRADSQFKGPADATAFDPKAKPGTKIEKEIFVDWTEAHTYAHLVLDREYGYQFDPQLSELPPTPRFLPEVMTGGSLVFLVPEAYKSVGLRLDFPNAKIGARTLRPLPIVLYLDSSSYSAPDRPALAAVDDDMFKLAVTAQQVAGEFAGTKPANGRFVVLDVTVRNESRQGEFFQTKKQLKLVTEKGEQLESAEATFAGPHRPAELVYVPGSERRTFQVAYDVPAAVANPRLSYVGVSLAKVLNLPPLGGGGATAGGPTTGPAGVAAAGGPAKAGPGGEVAMAPVNPPPAVSGAKAPAAKKPAGKLPTQVKAKQPMPPQGLAGAGLKAEQVNAAIDRGAAFLWASIQEEVKDPKVDLHREQLLYLLALVHADYHKKNPACEAVVRRALATVDTVNEGTYGAGIYLMLAESVGDAMYMPEIRRTAKYLVESQGKGGTWGYTGNKNPKLYARPEPDLTQPLSIIGGTPTSGPGSDREPIVRTGPKDAGEDGDNSVTQYAILGLHSAARMGVGLPKELWQKTYAGVRAWQDDEGGWGYQGGRAYGSMNCAGIGTLALCRFHLGEQDPAADDALERGLGWMDQKFSVSVNPESGTTWHFYYMYGMERVGRILDTEYLGDHEWYPFGSRLLVGKQMPDGGWKGEASEDDRKLATSFALLFLTRATPSLSIAARTGPGTIKTEMAAVPMNRVYVIMDASGSMLEEIGGKQKFAAAQEAVVALTESMPANTEVALRVYGHRKRAIEKDADQDTQLLVPMGKLDKAKLAATVRGLRCRGKTPLALSLKQAADDLKGTSTPANPVTLVLLTDGGEDTIPRQDPVKAAAEMAKVAGLSFQIVGFDINRPEWGEQLANMARAGQGQYLPAARAEVLLDRLQAAIYRTPDSFQVTDAAGKVVARGPFGQSVQLPEGKYAVSASLGGMLFTREAWVNTASTTVARFDAMRVDFSKASPAAAAAVPAPGTELLTVPPAPPPPAAAGGPAPPARPAPPAAARPKFCANCGKPLPATGKFCTNCGAKVPGT